MTEHDAPTTGALLAVDRIIADFGRHHRDAYFAGMATDATFLFHSTPGRIESRADYEQLWDCWQSEHSFEVVACESRNRRIQVFGTVAVFSHDVDTVIRWDGQTQALAERESIVLEQRNDVWLCVHEHLSTRS